MKLLSPQDLALISSFGVQFIRQNAVDFGFVKRGSRWVASEDMIKSALECSTNDRTPDFGIPSSSIVGRPYKSPLDALIKEKQKSIRKNSGSISNV